MGDCKKRVENEQNNSFLIQANNLCLICYKECTSESLRKAKLLCRILERYFSVNFIVPELSLKLQQSGTYIKPKSSRSNVHFLICENCSALSGKIGHLFKKLELVQMKLNACGQNLCDIMNSAEKVPSRTDMFNDRMASFQEEADSKVRIIQNVRREIVKKCNNKIKRKLTNSMLPTAKIVIKKMSIPDNNYVDNFPPLVIAQNSKDVTEPDENQSAALIGCTISFCLVVLLSFLRVDQPTQAEVEANVDATLSSSNTIAVTDDIEDILSQEGSESTTAFKILMTYKKRKQPKEKCKENEPPIKKPLLCDAATNTSGESMDSVSEEDVNKEEWRIVEVEQRQGNDTSQINIKNSSLITMDEAINAVKAIPLLYQGGNKNAKVKKEEANVHPTPTTKEEFPSWNDSAPKMECEDENILHPMMEVEENVQPQPPVEIDIKPVNQQDNSSTSSTSLALVPVNSLVPSNATKVTYKCHVCDECFNSRAKIEKHRVVVHNFINYVQCPSCSQMLPSYFQLELHRRDKQECRLGAREKQMELCDIARPYFPFEIIINGRHFCPFDGCCEVFEDIDNLIVHIKVHGKFQCQFGCSQIFGKGHELAVHELTFHRCGIVNAQRNVFQCPRCDFVSKRRDEYIPHFINAHLNIFTTPTKLS